MADGTLTVQDMERINRCRVRYQGGMPVPASDLHALGLSMDENGAKEVLGVYYDPKRPPAVEGGAGPWLGPIVSTVDVP